MSDARLRSNMGGKPVFTVNSSVLNMESGFKHKLLCDGPTFSAGTACNYSCTFCYVPAIMQKSRHLDAPKAEGFSHEQVVVRRADPAEVLRGQLLDAKGRPKYLDTADRRVAYASPLVDVAGNMELAKETVAMSAAILELTHWQIRLLSKSNLLPWVAVQLEEHCKRWDPRGRVIYGVSTGTLDDDLAAAIEQGTPLVSKRIRSIRMLQDNGYRTFGMVCPVLPSAMPAIQASEILNAILADECEQVWCEVINARGESFSRTVSALREAGYNWEADEMARYDVDKALWERWARRTFQSMAGACPPGKLRFLQYVNASNRGYWEQFSLGQGAVLL